MSKLNLNQNPKAAIRWNSYPADVQKKLKVLRDLVLEVATETDSISELEETLKWNEVSYLAKKGSTIRIDWKDKLPEQYAMYFKCTSKLVESFRAVFGNRFKYENNRAIVFTMTDEVPIKELKSCIHAALNYHNLKDQVNLGITRT